MLSEQCPRPQRHLERAEAVGRAICPALTLYGNDGATAV